MQDRAEQFHTGTKVNQLSSTDPPSAPAPGAWLDQSRDPGLTECMYVVDNSVKDQEIVCGEDAVVERLVRNDFGLFAVHLCEEHSRAHREFYRNRNRARSRPRRHN